MNLAFIPVAAALAFATPSVAQQQQPDNSRPAALNQAQNAPTQQQKSGTAPTGNSTTGWSGTDQVKPTDKSPDSSATQSELATGKDLKGPPQRFEGSATPE